MGLDKGPSWGREGLDGVEKGPSWVWEGPVEGGLGSREVGRGVPRGAGWVGGKHSSDTLD